MHELKEFTKVAVSWFLAVGAVMVALGYDLTTAYQAGLIAAIISLVWIVVLILPFEQSRQIFFYFDEQPSDVESFMHIGCLRSIPLIIVIWIPIILVIRWLTGR
ncbi:MAG: hypothetical protein GY792_05605 [Gammaproteobacteria bacterium]|nr:hypothetical protein [Gammaproteobacteria bacterium]